MPMREHEHSLKHMLAATHQSADHSAASNKSGFKSVAVYCGSSKGSRPEYMAAARDLGNELVKRGIKLVYGGEIPLISTSICN